MMVPHTRRGPRLHAVNQRQGYKRGCGSVSMWTFIFISFSRIWTSCCMEGRCPDSSLDQTGTSTQKRKIPTTSVTI